MDVSRSIHVFVDGGSSGNPGKAASAFVVFEESNLLVIHGEFLGHATNNFAEYRALDMALEWLETHGYRANRIEVFCDSALVVKQLGGEYKVKSRNLVEIHLRVKERLSRFASVEVRWIPREKNVLTDRLVKAILKGEKWF